MAGESQQTPSSVPDPTVLTTEALQREIHMTKELVAARFDGITTLIEERFRSVDQQFTLIEQHRIEQKTDTKTAVDAALSAQEKAVREQTTASGLAIAESNRGMTKQLEQMTATTAAGFSGQLVSINDLKERVSRMENVRAGGQQTISGIYALVGFLVMLGLATIAVVGFLATQGP